MKGIAQTSRRTIANKINGAKGGQAVVQKYGKDWIERRNAKGGRTVVELYGRDYFKYIRSLRKDYPSTGTRKGIAGRPKKVAA